MKLERRFANGLQFLNSFTWGKAIDNGTQALDGSNGNQASPQDVRNMAPNGHFRTTTRSSTTF